MSTSAPTPRPRYPWSDWSDGNSHLAIQGLDFDCTIPSFVALLHQKVKSPSFPREITHVSTSVEDNGVRFTFHHAPQ